MSQALISPMPLLRVSTAFNDPAWLWELKLDGFRALAFVEARICRLVSRNGHTFGQFTALASSLAATLDDGVYDGEIVCLDDAGKSQFDQVLFRRGTPIFAVFDVLLLRGRDLRALPLVERKQVLREVVPERACRLLYVQHVEADGLSLFQAACEHDLEGVVGKWRQGIYCCDGERTSWVKVKNAAYSQIAGRHELFAERGGGRAGKLKARRRLVLA